MSFLTDLMATAARAQERRSTDLSAEQERHLINLFGRGIKSDTGLTIDDETALSNSAVYAAFMLLTDSIAVPPLKVMKHDKDGGKTPDPKHRLFDTVYYQPNEWQNAYDYRSMGQGHLLSRGNFYNQIHVKDGRQQLIPLHPDRMSVHWTEAGKRFYRYRPGKGEAKTLLDHEVLHIKGLVLDGDYGLSPVRSCMNAIGLSVVTEKHGARLFGEAARPQGFFRHPSSVKKDARDNIKASLKEYFTGPDKSHGVMFLEEGLEWVSMGLKNDEAQFLETRKFQVNEIARIFRVPPHMIGDLERATFSNIEAQAIEFVTHSLLPWIKRWEIAMNLKLLDERERRKWSIQFNVDAFLRGDTLSRYKAYAIARQWGFMSINDVRRLEDQTLLPPEKGDVYLEPKNMIGNTGGDPDLVPKAEGESDGEANARAHRALQPVFHEAISRTLRKESNALRKAAKKSPDEFRSWASDFYQGLEQDMHENLRPAAEAVGELVGIMPVDMNLHRIARDYCAGRLNEVCPGSSVTDPGDDFTSNVMDRIWKG